MNCWSLYGPIPRHPHTHTQPPTPPLFLFSPLLGCAGLLEIVYTFVATVPFTLVIYWMVGFTNEADPFFLFLLTVGGLSLAFNSFGHLIVALVPNVAVAGIFGGLFMYACKRVGEVALLVL